MSLSAVERPRPQPIQAWLTANWPTVCWILTAVVILFAGARTLPEQYHHAAALKDLSVAERPQMRRALANLHLSPASVAWFEIIVFGLFNTIPNLVVSWLLIRRAWRTRFAGYLAFVFLASMNAQYPPSISETMPGQPVLQTITRLTTIVAISGFFLLPFLFPNGRFVPRWSVVWGIYLIASITIFAFYPSSDGSFPFSLAFAPGTTVLLIVSAIGSMLYRYHSVSSSKERQQIRWVMLGLLIGCPGFFLGDWLMRNISGSTIGVACLFGFLIVMPIVTTVPIVAIGIAMLRRNLFDVDLVLSQTLVWFMLTLMITATYIGLVLGIGDLINRRGSLFLSLVATGVVAVGFQPLRLHVEHLVNHLLFGDRDDPYKVLARLGHHIEDSLSASELLPAIVRTTAEMLRLPYVALFLEQSGGPTLVASSGSASPFATRLPLLYQGQTVGALEVAPRVPGDAFTPAERRLLEDLARQIGVAARTVSLAEELQQSRERIVTSREEERRRLRRDLHDGLGAQLAGLMLQVSRTRSLLRTDTDAADQKLADLMEELRSAVTDVRRLVQGLRPPALDELGLVGTVQARLSQLDGIAAGQDLAPVRAELVVAEPLPPLSAAIEVAALRIIEEAVTNVVKHAAASAVIVTLRIADDRLLIAVEDDGIGFSPTTDSSGLGLHSMRERATELGGTWIAGPGPAGRGTVVRVTIPVTPRAGGASA
ncbi:MAG TPA: sensor histidine kinase [Thermomicrobiales bacterium]|nr:sensor histidine kinase [Thermomicrobiales bacterium]